MSLEQEVRERVEAYLLEDPEADRATMRAKFYPLVKDERRKRAEAEALLGEHAPSEPPPDVSPKARIESLFASGLLKRGGGL